MACLTERKMLLCTASAAFQKTTPFPVFQVPVLQVPVLPVAHNGSPNFGKPRSNVAQRAGTKTKEACRQHSPTAS
jgi:hypothetical protein